jgi:hypothetical protein
MKHLLHDSRQGRLQRAYPEIRRAAVVCAIKAELGELLLELVIDTERSGEPTVIATVESTAAGVAAGARGIPPPTGPAVVVGTANTPKS